MDRIFMDEYYEHLRADNIEAFSKETERRICWQS